MELRKENIHRLGTGSADGISSSFTVDDDFNVPDIRPDVKAIIRENGKIRITEKKCNAGRLHIKGTLVTNILYIGEDSESVQGIEAEIPFDEMLHIDREDCTGMTIRAELDDLTAGLIHSRKINVKALVTVKLFYEEIQDEIVVTETEGKGLFARAKDISFTNLAAAKRDTVRVREEVQLPSSRPNIAELLYKEMHLVVSESRVMEEELSVKGTMSLFVVYRGNSLKESTELYETKVPFMARFELSGARPDMIEDISVAVLQENITSGADEDGEERLLNVEVVLELDMKLYEEKELTVLEDIYSVSGEVKLKGQEQKIPQLLIKNQGIGSFGGTYELPETSVTPMQIAYGNGEVHLEKTGMEGTTLTLEGMLEFKLLLITGSDEKPFIGVRFYVPLEHKMEVRDLNENCSYKVTPVLTDSSFQLYRSDEIEWKAEVNFQTMVFCNRPEYMITDAEFVPFTGEEPENRYKMIGYRSEAGDTLWSVGKRFHLSPDEVAERNHLEEEVIPPGRMLFLVREA